MQTTIRPLAGLSAGIALAGLLGACASTDAPESVAPATDVPVPAEPAPPPAPTRPTEVSITVRLDAGSLPDAPEAPLPYADLVTRLQGDLSLPVMERSEVDAQLNWYVRHPGYIDRVFKRSGRFLHFIMAELERRDMPADLALLPIVESAYDPFAYSHGRAAGLWQIIPGTGRRFGLKQNWWYDGRRDIVESTRAALDYLQFLADEFDGDWLLAVAAYNSGEGTVHRAQRKNRRAGKPTDFWHLKLPRETRGYVPRLLALRRLMEDPAAHGITLPTVPDAPYFKVLELPGQMDLALAADLAGVDVEDIYGLNPGFNRWATDPDGPHRLLVPYANWMRTADAVAALEPGDRVRWVRYRIRTGDSLITIAKRHETTPAVIREVNGIRGNTIRAGDHLMLPTATRELNRYTMSADRRLAATQNRARSGQRQTYTVKPGDSLWDIARTYGVTTRQLAKWNGMAPGDTLSVGRRLVVWSSRSAPATGPAGRTRRIQYTVRRGDSLSRISSRFRVSVSQLRKWNNLYGERYLQPGQRLVMYVDVTRQSGG